MGVSLKQIWIEKTGTIAGNGTAVVDSFDISENTMAHYEMNFTEVTNLANKKFRTLKLDARVVDSGTKDTVCGRSGLGLSLAISTQLNGSDFELVVVNNNSFAVDFSFARIKLK